MYKVEEDCPDDLKKAMKHEAMKDERELLSSCILHPSSLIAILIPPMSSRRVLKAAEAIREVVSMAILTELKDPRIRM